MTAFSARPVVLLTTAGNVDPGGHDHLTRVAMAERIAVLRGGRYAGEFDPRAVYDGRPYFIPDRTLLEHHGVAYGIRDADDLFGGVVPHAFLTGKTISHPLVDPDAAAPAGWSQRLAERLGDAVLPGYSAFSVSDAMRAGRRLLASGRVRVKAAHGIGGDGQVVLDSQSALQDAIESVGDGNLHADGVVIERDLGDARVYSVGEVRVAGMPFAYYGTQFLAEDRDGQPVYGGSELTVVRGSLQDLSRLRLGDDVDGAVQNTLRYDAAVSAEFPTLFASRRNYDVAYGEDSEGRLHCGVLEQSWRIGGATPAEIAAIEALRSDPSLTSVVASTHEIHTREPAPTGARVHFHDPECGRGPILKYSLVGKHGRTA